MSSIAQHTNELAMSNVEQYKKSADIESLLQQAFNVCLECIKTLRTQYLHLPEEEYFLEVIQAYYKPAERKPKIILLGTDFPEEIIYALTGKVAYHIIGGSRVLTDASDEYVPRDTDPVTRSVLGQLFTMEYMRQSALVVISCASDAQRKAANLLQERGWKVVTVWIPSVHNEASRRVYLSELEHAVRAICRHVGRRFSNSALDRSVKVYEKVRTSIRAFTAAAEQIPGPMRMAILESFYMMSDLEGWCKALDALTAALPTKTAVAQNCPRVLLVGSPVYIPNYKIPFLLHGSGLDICASIDSNTALLHSSISAKGTLERLAAHYFDWNASPAFVDNAVLHDSVASQIEKKPPDGIIWHVLKGQIEYDFELVRNEKYFEQCDIPVIRLETDYQYQDIEQMRIRIEAFAELLKQKKMEKRRFA